MSGIHCKNVTIDAIRIIYFVKWQYAKYKIVVFNKLLLLLNYYYFPINYCLNLDT